MLKLQTDIPSTWPDYPVPDSGFIIENLDNFFSSPPAIALILLGVIDDDISVLRLCLSRPRCRVSSVPARNGLGTKPKRERATLQKELEPLNIISSSSLSLFTCLQRRHEYLRNI